MKPTQATSHDLLPDEISRLQLRSRLVASVVEDDRRTDARSSIAIDRGHVRSADAIMLEALVERSDTHRSHTLIDQLTDRRIDHRGGNGCVHAKATGQIGSAIELTPTDMDAAFRRLAERNHARVEAMHHGSEREEVEFTTRWNLQQCNLL